MTADSIRARVRSAPGVARLRAYAEHVFAPNLRRDVHELRRDVDRMDRSQGELRPVVEELSAEQRRDGEDLRALRSGGGEAAGRP